MNLFFEPAAEPNLTQISLNPQESKHAVQVLRHKPGDELWVTNGRGWLFKTLITSDSPKECVVDIIEKKFTEKFLPAVEICVSPTKNADRIEWLLEKCTEAGVDSFCLLYCKRTERKRVRTDRLERIIESAMKQSMNLHRPNLCEVFFEDLVSDNFAGEKFIGWCETGQDLHLKKLHKPGNSARVLIGPEGDFTPEEVEMAQEKGYQAMSLGQNRLRTETAAFVSLITLNTLNTL